MQISVSMHQRITSTGLNTEVGKVGNPAEVLQRIPKYNYYIHRDVDFTWDTFIKNK